MEDIFVTKPFLPSREDFDGYVDRIWETHTLTNDGPLHQEFQRKLALYLGVPRIELTVNGHSALELALREGIGASGEVITSPFTFASTVHAIKRVGGDPVFADIKLDDMTIDPVSVERCITENTAAIVPVHVYGHPCDTKALRRIADKYRLKLVYDAAHAFGVRRNGASILQEGDLSILSFHATKLFNSCEGGAVVYSDEQIGHALKVGKNFGILSEETVECSGGNGKMNELQAAMGLAILPYMNDIIRQRRLITEHYRARLAECNYITLFYPESNPGTECNYSYFPILIRPETGTTRNEVYEKLKSEHIYSRRYFWPLASDYECYRECKQDDLSRAKQVSDQILCLPIYPGLDKKSLDYICDRLMAAL